MDLTDFAAPGNELVKAAGNGNGSASSTFGQVGSTGLSITGGQVQQEFLKELRGDRGMRLFREMADNDAVIGALLFAIEMLIRQINWRVEPHEDGEDDEAEFIEEALHDMVVPWEDTLSSIISMLVYGWSVHEICYKRRDGYDEDEEKSSKFTDGKIGWSKFEIRSQETRLRWEQNETGKVIGMVQAAPPSYQPVIIPLTKCVHFRTTATKNNPEGRSVLRNAFMSWHYKKHIEMIEAIGVERDLAGLPVGKVPPIYLSDSATPEQAAAADEFKKILRQMKRNEQEGVLWPNAFDDNGNALFTLELLASAGARQFDTDKVIARHDQRIAMTVLADFILLGHENVGSFALGSSKIDLFTAAIEAWVRMISSEINTQAIPRLLKANGMDPATPPCLTYDRVQRVDLPEIGDYIAKLAAAGAPMFPNPEMERYLLDIAGLPLPEQVAQDVGGGEY